MCYWYLSWIGHLCADEGQECACYGYVTYGYDHTWSEHRVANGKIVCANDVFGDPLYGVKKKCLCSPTSK